jgi:hypothetical protein
VSQPWEPRFVDPSQLSARELLAAIFDGVEARPTTAGSNGFDVRVTVAMLRRARQLIKEAKKMTVEIEFDTDNAAFEDNFEDELARVLRQVRWKVAAQRVRAAALCEHSESVDVLLDGNGNTIGRVVFRP